MGGFRINNTHTNYLPPFLDSTPGRFARVIRGVPTRRFYGIHCPGPCLCDMSLCDTRDQASMYVAWQCRRSTIRDEALFGISTVTYQNR
jgi:hypothetical protein